ncbi:MAG: hypothetical protein V1659_05860 [Candidatus Woesearchaeota archaeon]
MTNIHDLQFDDTPAELRFKPYYDGKTPLIERIPQLVGTDGRSIIKPERVMERRTRATEPAKTNWQNTGTHTSLVQITHPDREKTRWFNQHPLTETIKPGCPPTIDYGLATTEKDFYFNGAPFATINKRQIQELEKNRYAFTGLREQIWIEVIAAGDEKLFEEYKTEFEAKTGRTFEQNGMGIYPTLRKGLRLGWLGSFVINHSDAISFDGLDGSVGCVFGVASEQKSELETSIDNAIRDPSAAFTFQGRQYRVIPAEKEEQR